MLSVSSHCLKSNNKEFSYCTLFSFETLKLTQYTMSFKIVLNFLSVCLLLTILDCCLCNSNTISTETPGFFLKVTKNVPRLGRRSHQLSDFENFFLKTSKSVPRIGRSDGVSITKNMTPFFSLNQVDARLKIDLNGSNISN